MQTLKRMDRARWKFHYISKKEWLRKGFKILLTNLVFTLVLRSQIVCNIVWILLLLMSKVYVQMQYCFVKNSILKVVINAWYSPPSEEAADWKRTKRDMSERLLSWPPVLRQETEDCVSPGIEQWLLRCVSVVCLWVCVLLGNINL